MLKFGKIPKRPLHYYLHIHTDVIKPSFVDDDFENANGKIVHCDPLFVQPFISKALCKNCVLISTDESLFVFSIVENQILIFQFNFNGTTVTEPFTVPLEKSVQNIQVFTAEFNSHSNMVEFVLVHSNHSLLHYCFDKKFQLCSQHSLSDQQISVNEQTQLSLAFDQQGQSHLFYLSPEQGLIRLRLALEEKETFKPLVSKSELSKKNKKVAIRQDENHEIILFYLNKNDELVKYQPSTGTNSIVNTKQCLPCRDDPYLPEASIKLLDIDHKLADYMKILSQVPEQQNLFAMEVAKYQHNIHWLLIKSFYHVDATDKAYLEIIHSLHNTCKNHAHELKSKIGHNENTKSCLEILKVMQLLCEANKETELTVPSQDIILREQQRFYQQCHLHAPENLESVKLKQLLQQIKEFCQKEGFKQDGVFISYAWPTPEIPCEFWTQQFVRALADDLEHTGIRVDVDQKTSGSGTPLFEFMHHKIKDNNTTLIVCNRTMMFKFKQNIKGVCNEYCEAIQSKTENSEHRIFPILLTSVELGSMPGTTRMFAPESLYQLGYLLLLKKIINHVYRIGPNHQNYNQLWEKANIQESSTMKQCVNFEKFSQHQQKSTVRKNELFALNQYFNTPKALFENRCVLISGLSGSGKTTLAYSYISSSHKFYELVVYLDAGSKTAFEFNIDKTIKALPIKPKQNTNNLLLLTKYLIKHSCLLIIDNVFETELVAPLFKIQSSDMIIIAQEKLELPIAHKHLPLRELSKQQAIELFESVSSVPVQHIENSLQDNICLPSDIVMTVNFCQQITGYEKSNFSDLLQKALDTDSKFSGLTPVLEYLNKNKFDSAMMNALYIIVCLDSGAIPVLLFEMILEKDWQKTFNFLRDSHLITYQFDEDALYCLQRTTTMLKKVFTNELELRSLQIKLLEVINQLWKNLDYSNHQSYALGRQLMHHSQKLIADLMKTPNENEHHLIISAVVKLIDYLYIVGEKNDFITELFEKLLNTDIKNDELYYLACRTYRDSQQMEKGLSYLKKVDLMTNLSTDPKVKLQQFTALIEHHIFDIDRIKVLYDKKNSDNILRAAIIETINKIDESGCSMSKDVRYMLLMEHACCYFDEGQYDKSSIKFQAAYHLYHNKNPIRLFDKANIFVWQFHGSYYLKEALEFCLKIGASRVVKINFGQQNAHLHITAASAMWITRSIIQIQQEILLEKNCSLSEYLSFAVHMGETGYQYARKCNSIYWQLVILEGLFYLYLDREDFVNANSYLKRLMQTASHDNKHPFAKIKLDFYNTLLSKYNRNIQDHFKISANKPPITNFFKITSNDLNRTKLNDFSEEQIIFKNPSKTEKFLDNLFKCINEKGYEFYITQSSEKETITILFTADENKVLASKKINEKLERLAIQFQKMLIEKKFIGKNKTCHCKIDKNKRTFTIFETDHKKREIIFELLIHAKKQCEEWLGDFKDHSSTCLIA